MQREAASAEMAARLRDVSSTLDISAYVGRIGAPTLVMHRRQDQIVPFERGRELAAAFERARFVTLEGSDHLLWYGDTPAALQAIADFLGDVVEAQPRPTAPAPSSDGLTTREVQVLRLLAAGHSNKEIAAMLQVTVPTIERHLVNLYRKIDARGRANATVYALRHGLDRATA